MRKIPLGKGMYWVKLSKKEIQAHQYAQKMTCEWAMAVQKKRKRAKRKKR